MKVYVAARFTRQMEVRSIADQLERSLGHQCTSRWAFLEDARKTYTEQERTVWADIDYQDVFRADAVLFLSEDEEAGYMSGGRHVEFGIALALGIPIVVVGPKENIFHYSTITNIHHAEHLGAAFDILETL